MSIIQSRRRADLAAVAVSGLSKAWTTYTPTITSGTGTLTTVSATGRYLLIGKLMHLQVDIAITTNGTGGANISATLPVNAATSPYLLPGREYNITAKVVSARTGSNTIAITYYDATYPGADGARIVVSGLYETV